MPYTSDLKELIKRSRRHGLPGGDEKEGGGISSAFFKGETGAVGEIPSGLQRRSEKGDPRGSQ